MHHRVWYTNRMTTPEKGDSQPEVKKTPEELSDRVTAIEIIRTNDKFPDALKTAIAELSKYIDNFEKEPPAAIAKIAKLARAVVSSAESSAKRAPMPEAKVEFYKAALTYAVEPFYENSVFIKMLTDAIQSGTLTSDEPELIFEMWRDVAKIGQSSAALYKADREEELTRFSGWAWEELLKQLPDDHKLTPFMRIEYQVFLADIGMKVNAKQVAEDIEALKLTDLDANPHRLGTMALRVEKLGRKIGDKSVTQAGRKVFDELKKKHPDIAKLLENPMNSFKALMKKASDGLISPNSPSPSKEALYPRLTALKKVPFLPQPISDIQ